MDRNVQLEKSIAEIRNALAASSGAGAVVAVSRKKTIASIIIGLLVLGGGFFAWQRGGVTEPAPVVAEPSEAYGLASASTQLTEFLPTEKNLPDMHITAGLVKELGSSESLFLYRPRARWPIASISKLMAAVVAKDQFDTATILTVTQEAVDTEGFAGNMKVGEKYSIADLIKLMLTVSSNDATMLVAQHYDQQKLGAEGYASALSKTALFTALMQQKARELGLNETYFGEPTGLSMVNQSVVGDLAVLASYIQATYPDLFVITANAKNTVLERKRMVRRTETNINPFSGQKGFLGGKTGFTDEAGQGLLSLFEVGGKKYLTIVLGTEDRAGETSKLRDWIKNEVAAR